MSQSSRNLPGGQLDEFCLETEKQSMEVPNSTVPANLLQSGQDYLEALHIAIKWVTRSRQRGIGGGMLFITRGQIALQMKLHDILFSRMYTKQQSSAFPPVWVRNNMCAAIKF